MVYRKMYRGYWENKDIVLNDVSGVYNASCAFYGDMIYLYFETENENVSPEQIIDNGVKTLPDGRKWESMNDIFHYSKPISKEHWQRKTKKSPIWMFNCLRPEGVSKYIYYHFQYQEEYPGDGDKYGIIFNIENQIVMYLEKPCEMEEEQIAGMLTTKNSPRGDDWQKVMDTMFKPWNDGTIGWKRMEIIEK